MHTTTARLAALSALSTVFTAGALFARTADADSDSKDPKAIFDEGLSLGYNTEYKEASKLFDRYIALVPEDPAGYWRKLLCEYFELRYAQNTNTPVLTAVEYRKLVAIAESGITKAETKAKAGERVSFHRYVEASIMSVLAALQFKNESKVKTLATLKETIRIAGQSSCQDAGFLVGFVNFQAAKYGFLAFLAGIPHDREEGRAMIFRAANQNSSPFVDDIWFFIFEMERSNHDRYAKVATEKTWRYLYQKYPRNRALIAYKNQH